MAQGVGLWVRGRDGLAETVQKHELSIANPHFRRRFGIERAEELLAGLSPHRAEDQDPIRIVGLRLGLVRVRDTGGVIAIQFWAPRGKVKEYLYNTWVACDKANLWGSQARIENFQYKGDQAQLPWEEFERRVQRGDDILINEAEALPIGGEIQRNPEFMARLDARLQELGILDDDQ